MGYTSTEVKRRYNEKVYKRVTLDLPKEMAEKFTEKCEKLNISKRQVLVEAVDKFLRDE